jgi:hypothetical protein
VKSRWPASGRRPPEVEVAATRALRDRVDRSRVSASVTRWGSAKSTTDAAAAGDAVEDAQRRRVAAGRCDGRLVSSPALSSSS